MQTTHTALPPFIDQPPARPLYREDWTCRHCGRHLAHIEGRTLTLPGGTVAALPNVIRCHRCKQHNTHD